MEQKIKIAIIGLVVLLFASFVIILGALGSKQTLERRIAELNSERTVLNKQAEDIALQKRQLEEKFNTLNNDMKKTAQEKQDLQKKYDELDKTKEDLLGQIKALKEAPPAVVSAQAQQIVAAAAANEQPPASDAYWGEILKAKGDLEVQITAVRNELKGLQITNEQLEREKSNLGLDLTSLTRDNQDLRRQLQYNQKVMDSVIAELTREKNDKGSIQENLKAIKTENEVLKRQMKILTTRKANLDRRLVEAQEKNSTLEKRFDEMEVLLKDKMSQAENIKTRTEAAPQKIKDESVELPPITVRPPQPAVSAAKPRSEARSADNSGVFRGKIVALNRDNNFVVVDIGQDSGVSVGDTFQVYRDNKMIGKLETIQVRQNIAACDIGDELSSVRVGDSIR
jgi:predicted nuclease with TOPRIM domain